MSDNLSPQVILNKVYDVDNQALRVPTPAVDALTVHSKSISTSVDTPIFSVPMVGGSGALEASMYGALMVTDGTDYATAAIDPLAITVVVKGGVVTADINGNWAGPYQIRTTDGVTTFGTSYNFTATYNAGVLTIGMHLSTYSGMTPSTGYPKLKFSVSVYTGQTVTYL